MLHKMMSYAPEEQFGESTATTVADDNQAGFFTFGQIHKDPCSIPIHENNAFATRNVTSRKAPFPFELLSGSTPKLIEFLMCPGG